MFEPEQICPYTGLRSFTEEESLYFKGREEEIDQATEQLQRNKFLMLTGASGDGKSSLIYAGIIPNARAGFLKSKYSQWCVADFRPERTPFQNLCKAIAAQLDIDSASSVEAELNHGFSAIIDLYKNSKRYIDVSAVEWQSADEAGKATLKRTAANLVILVDQFEEFFTNPENYHKGVPSTDANLVLNLLLETARIALEEDLPIYIVFTMRSDYIGQCASFRGLPEYIGFSQFFVPRLNRTQLQQVIEEPSILSGNRITRRLTERLIHDLKEGVDQLPILQHALNQIWHAAENGKDEMDLIHYAKVGGMPVNELPDNQVEQFENWFDDLPPEIKACYHEPNLQNVLDTHTNKLYEQAAKYYEQNNGRNIADKDAKAIIRTTFTCLTKIDQSRAVRNRMTLQEITHILNRPEFGTKEVGAVLNIFREPGNTFIRPFITDDPETHQLNESDVLDITHESLIRNWEYLEQWAKEEFDNYTISLDFEQQLNRWIESGRSKGFLLSIGPLTYFENWFNSAKPNAYWIARYLPEEIEQDNKLSNAKQVLVNARDFLRRSANKHIVTRTIIRYGARRIAAVVGLLAILIFSSFAVRNHFRKQNDAVLRSVETQSFELLNKRKLSLEYTVPVITAELILGNVTIPEAVDAVKDQQQKIRIATGIASQLIVQGHNEPRREILQSLSIADSLMEDLQVNGNGKELADELKFFYDYSVTAGMAFLFNEDPSIKSLVFRNANRSAKWAMYVLKEQPGDYTQIQYLSLGLENGINYKIYTNEEIAELLQILSPFEESVATPWRKENYKRDKVLSRGTQTYGPTYNGLYQDLAYLYAASGQADMALQCMDTLLKYQAGFYQNDYASHVDNATNIAAVFYTYGTTDELDAFVRGYCTKKNISSIEFYNRLVSRTIISPTLSSHQNFYTPDGGQKYSNLNLALSTDSLIGFFFSKFREEILKTGNNDERNYLMAVCLKNEATLIACRKHLRGIAETGTDTLYRNAVAHYRQVSPAYLNQLITAIGSTASEQISMSQKFLFLYPDYRVTFHPFEPRSILQFYQSHSFIEYLLEQNLFDSLYRTTEELKYFERWLYDYQAVRTTDWYLRDPMPLDFMTRLSSKLEERKANESADLNVLYLHISVRAFHLNETEKGIAYLRHIQTNNLLNMFQYKNLSEVNAFSFELVAQSIANLCIHDQYDLAYSFLNVFKKEVNRSSLYAYASQLISLNKQSPGVAQRLLDSARVEMNRLDNPADFQPNRHQIAIALMYQDPVKNSDEAYSVIKNSFEKFSAVWRFSKAYAFHGNLYKAMQQVPRFVSSFDRSAFLQSTVEGIVLTKPAKKEWEKFTANQLIFARLYLPYVNENQ